MNKSIKGREKLFIFGLFSSLLVISCQKQIAQMGLITTAELVGDLSPEVQKYDIPFVVGEGLPSNILLLESALSIDPENEKILSTLAEMYCSYGAGFVEDRDIDKAKLLYHKGYQYAEKALSVKNGDFREALEKLKKNQASPEDLAKTITEEDVKEAFWYASCLGYWISASKGSPESVAEISKLLAFVDRLIEVKKDFMYGGPLLLKATFLATAPSILGGSPVKAKYYFTETFKISKGKFLLAKVVYAQFYATLLKDRTEKEIYEEEIERLKNKIESYKNTIEQTDDPEIKRKLEEQKKKIEKDLKWLSSEEVAALFSDKTGEQIFEETINEILEADSYALPDAVLPNEIAKEKAKILLQKKAELF